MNVLVTGGSASGKSVFAERLTCRLSPRRTYLATMSSEGREARERIARHRAQRADQGFTTIECVGTLEDSQLQAHEEGGVVLLDDVGNLVANALFAPDGSMADADEVLKRLESEVCALADRFDHVVVVGNEVGAEGRSGADGTETWARLMGSLCCRIAAWSDLVVEVVAGCPVVVKGELP